MMTSWQSGSPIGGEGNTQTTHGSIVVELIINTMISVSYSIFITSLATLKQIMHNIVVSNVSKQDYKFP